MSSNEKLLLRGAFVPTLITSIVAIVAATAVKGSSGFLGALLAQFVVVIFCHPYRSFPTNPKLRSNLNDGNGAIFLLCKTFWLGAFTVGDC